MTVYRWRSKLVAVGCYAALAILVVLITHKECQGEVALMEEAQLVSHNWLSYLVFQNGGWAGVTTPELQEGQEIIQGQIVMGYYFPVAPSGYIVVPVLKELPPIKAYSEVNQHELNAMDGFPALLKEVLLHRITVFSHFYGGIEAVQPPTGIVLFDRAHRTTWNFFLQPEKQFQADLKDGKFQRLSQVGPLLSTEWDQRSPYNNLCPIGDGGRTLVGCVPLATAQILRYWNWPTTGTGSHSYIWDGDDSCGGSTAGATLSADYSDGYDWANMPIHCDAGCTSAQQNALSELCYEVAVAYETDFGYCGSAAATSYALYVLPTYFRYDPAIDRENRDNHTAAEWFAIIQTEINNGRPLQYRIQSHSIVCDGWRDTGGMNQYHMNYGWSDSHTAWYTLDGLYCPWAGCDPLVEYLIRYIQPLLNNYVDIGLRCHDGTGIIAFACEPAGTLTSPLRIRKGATTYGVVLVDPADSMASSLRVRTSSGIKAIRKY